MPAVACARPMTRADAQSVELLFAMRELIAEIRALRAALPPQREGTGSRQRGDTDDRVRTEALCSAVSALYGSEPATCRDWLDDSRQDAPLRLALGAFVAPGDSRSAKSLGRYVAARAWTRNEPQCWGRFLVRRDEITSTRRDGAAWIVESGVCANPARQ